MTTLTGPERLGRDELTTIERIRDAALRSFATHGSSDTSLRSVAAAAGVSLGLVQHHFATKAGLIKSVDDYVMELVVTAMAQPLPEPPADSVAEIGGRVTRIIAEQPDLAGYVGRALVDGSPLGATIFDTLMTVGKVRWHERAERGETRSDVDLTWAAMNALVLALGCDQPPHAHRPAPSRAVDHARPAPALGGRSEFTAARRTVPAAWLRLSNP